MYNSINNYNKLIKIFLKNIFSRFLFCDDYKFNKSFN